MHTTGVFQRRILQGIAKAQRGHRSPYTLKYRVAELIGSYARYLLTTLLCNLHLRRAVFGEEHNQAALSRSDLEDSSGDILHQWLYQAQLGKALGNIKNGEELGSCKRGIVH